MRNIKIIDTIVNGHLSLLEPDYAVVDNAEEADAILIRSTNLHGYVLPPSIRCIAWCDAGVNTIPFEEYAHKGVVVFNTPGANANAVKELFIGLIMITSRDIVGGLMWCQNHAEDQNILAAAEKHKKAFVGHEAQGRRIGVVSLGNVGVLVANACVDLGMQVYGFDPYLCIEHAWQLSRDVHHVDDLHELCRNCDCLTLHVPSTKDTEGMIGTQELALTNDQAVLINCSRGTIIDEDAVAKALESDKLSRFASDFATPKVMRMRNTLVTPHVGAGTIEAEKNCVRMAITEVKDYLETGNIKNSVNYPTCDMGICEVGGRIACLYADIPGILGKITDTISRAGVNVQKLSNEAAGENAYTVFNTNEHLERDVIDQFKTIDSMWRVSVLNSASSTPEA